MMYKIHCNFSDSYTRHLHYALSCYKKEHNFILIDDKTVEKEHVYINDELVGYIAYRDGFDFNSKEDIPHIYSKKFKLIFKFHYSPNIFDYTKYNDRCNNIKACGLWRSWENTPFDKHNILNNNRHIDVVASMRHINSSGTIWPWSKVRLYLKEQAAELEKEGYKTVYNMVEQKQYEKLLLHTKTAFIWSASAYLGWKIPEFIQQGVIMITEPLGADYMLCNNTIIENDTHAIFCNDPTKFKSLAKDLIKDTQRMNYMRQNLVELWDDKLQPKKVGQWLYENLIDAYHSK